MKMSELRDIKRDILREFPEATFEVRPGGKHLKFVVTANGKTTMIPVSNTSSAKLPRYRKNSVANILAALRG